MEWLFTLALCAWSASASIYIKCTKNVEFKDDQLSRLGYTAKISTVILTLVIFVLAFLL